MSKIESLAFNTECDLTDLTLGKFDFDKKASAYEEHQPKHFLASSAFKLDGKPLVISFDGTLSSDRILVSEFDGSESYSLPIELEDDDQLALFSTFSTTLADHLATVEDGNCWNLTEIVKEDKIYLKIKFPKNQKNPAFKSNVVINNKKINDTKIFQGQKVTVTANVNFYFNFATQVAGASLTIRSLMFEVNGDEEEEVSETPKRKSREPLVPATPRKPKRMALEDLPSAVRLGPRTEEY